MTRLPLLPADALQNMALGISASESHDLDRLGLVEDHFHLALGEIGRSILSSGGIIYYGGHLRPDGYTSLLVEELQRVGRRDSPLKICLSWSEHHLISSHDIFRQQDAMGLHADLILLSPEGEEVTVENRNDMHFDEAKALSSLREYIVGKTHVRVLLGGKRSGYNGVVPGVMEEALISIQSGKPLFLAGGFGGATLDMIRVLRPEIANWCPEIEDEVAQNRAVLQEIKATSELSGWTLESNGLSAEENAQLAATYRPSEIASLIGAGLARLTSP